MCPQAVWDVHPVRATSAGPLHFEHAYKLSQPN